MWFRDYQIKINSDTSDSNNNKINNNNNINN